MKANNPAYQELVDESNAKLEQACSKPASNSSKLFEELGVVEVRT